MVIFVSKQTEMAKTGGALRSKTGGIGRDGGGDYKGDVRNVYSLREIKDTQLRREIQQGISKFESRLGVRQQKVKLADLSGAFGVHVTAGGKSEGVYLSRGAFLNSEPNDIIKVKRKAYDTNFLNKTNKPVQHTIVHELAHATWNNHLTGTKQEAAGREISRLYRAFLKQNPRRWGSYGKSNVNEFFAEGITLGVLGKGDKYSRELIRITKRYNL